MYEYYVSLLFRVVRGTTETSYRGTSFSFLLVTSSCRVISYYVTAVSIWRSFLNLWPPDFVSGLEADDNLSRNNFLDISTTINRCFIFEIMRSVKLILIDPRSKMILSAS